MGHAVAVVKRTLRSFYDDQMTHHAAALTYYSLMSLFPALLLALSLLGLVGQYPETYDAIIGYLRDVVPASLLDRSTARCGARFAQGDRRHDAGHQHRSPSTARPACSRRRGER